MNALIEFWTKCIILIQGQKIMFVGIICLKKFDQRTFILVNFILKLIPPARVNLQNFNNSCIYCEH